MSESEYTQLGSKLAVSDSRPDLLHFFCPACQCSHHLVGSGPSAWNFNRDYDKPTFSPSIGHSYTVPMTDTQYDEYRSSGSLPPRINVYCHSYITDGKIIYQPDCSHAMAGQTVDLPDWSES